MCAYVDLCQDTLRDKCDTHPDCVKNCCLYPFVAPIFFVVFVLMAQFVLVNVVVAVLMKHLEESHKLVCVFILYLLRFSLVLWMRTILWFKVLLL